MSFCDIRLDRRLTGWLLTVTIEGRSDTYSKLFEHENAGFRTAAADGIREAIARSPNRKPSITARGMGAIYIKMEANSQRLECEIRQAHPNRRRSPPETP